MREVKRKKLGALGWRAGSAAEFLGLAPKKAQSHSFPIAAGLRPWLSDEPWIPAFARTEAGQAEMPCGMSAPPTGCAPARAQPHSFPIAAGLRPWLSDECVTSPPAS